MGKGFVNDGEAQIEKDLKEKFEEVDMPVSFSTSYTQTGSYRSLVVTCLYQRKTLLSNHIARKWGENSIRIGIYNC